jgi:hypothetical protein
MDIVGSVRKVRRVFYSYVRILFTYGATVGGWN